MCPKNKVKNTSKRKEELHGIGAWEKLPKRGGLNIKSRKKLQYEAPNSIRN